jgi:hypothetical protein
MQKRLTILMAALLMLTTLGLSNIQPARADGAASTRNLLLGAAAIAAGFIISNNVAHKNQLANSVAGYTPKGDTVYQDGRVVDQNGNSYYPGNNGQSIACQDNACQIISDNAANGNNAYNGYYRSNGSNWSNNGYNNNYNSNGYNGYNGNAGYTAVNIGLGFGNNGYDRNGYDRNGYDRNGYNRSGYDRNGYNRNDPRGRGNWRNQNNGRGQNRGHN